MQADAQAKKLFLFGIILLCCIFAGMQLYLSPRTMFTPDELWIAHSVYTKYKFAFPYRDFAPYKTVLGYYLFLIPLSLTQDPVSGLIYLKIFLSLINTAFLFICALWFGRFFSYPAIITSVALLIVTNFFINFSTDIRVDLLAYWFSLITILFLLDKRFIYAGIFLGLAFCISQKAIWYGLACNISLALVWLGFQRTRKELLAIVRFNLSFILVVMCYLGFFVYFSHLNAVLDSVFYQAAIVYKINLYQSEHPYMLSVIIGENLFYLSLWPLSLISLLVKTPNTNMQRRVFILIFAWVTLFLLVIYKQPFFYYTTAVMPPLLLLYADFFTWLNDLLQAKATLFIQRRYLIYLFIFSTLCLGMIRIEFLMLPSTLTCISMMLILCIPTCIYLCIRTNMQWQPRIIGIFSLTFIYLIVAVSGIFISLTNNKAVFVQNGYEYQQLAIHTLNQLVKDDSTYIAGIDLLYNKNQIISGNSYLQQNLLFLDQPNAALQRLMLPALDLSPTDSIAKIIASLNSQPVKVFVHCPFMDRLPALIDYLTSQYAYLWGNIYIYGPQIETGKQHVQIKFAGNYTLESPSPILLDGQKRMPHANFHLTAKSYESLSDHTFRLVLLPEGLSQLPKKYSAEIPERLFSECKELYINHHRYCLYANLGPPRNPPHR